MTTKPQAGRHRQRHGRCARGRRDFGAWRRRQFDITMFGEEPYGNYNRILLSDVLNGSHEDARIFLNPLAWYEENGIKLHAGVRASKILATRQVGRGRGGRRRKIRPADHRHRQPAVHSAIEGLTLADGQRQTRGIRVPQPGRLPPDHQLRDRARSARP